MKRFITPLLTAAILFAAPLSASAEDLATITVGQEPTPLRVVLIIYAQLDPGATIADFRKDNPDLASLEESEFVAPGTTFFAPSSDRENI